MWKIMKRCSLVIFIRQFVALLASLNYAVIRHTAADRSKRDSACLKWKLDRHTTSLSGLLTDKNTSCILSHKVKLKPQSPQFGEESEFRMECTSV